MKEITCDTESAQMLPAYLISLLVYFYLRTNNLKMARALIKNRRFVVDADHIVQPVKTSPTPGNAPLPGAGANASSTGPASQKYSKKQ